MEYLEPLSQGLSAELLTSDLFQEQSQILPELVHSFIRSKQQLKVENILLLDTGAYLNGPIKTSSHLDPKSSIYATCDG